MGVREDDDTVESVVWVDLDSDEVDEVVVVVEELVSTEGLRLRVRQAPRGLRRGRRRCQRGQMRACRGSKAGRWEE